MLKMALSPLFYFFHQKLKKKILKKFTSFCLIHLFRQPNTAYSFLLTLCFDSKNFISSYMVFFAELVMVEGL
jgi:hypothetical protein